MSRTILLADDSVTIQKVVELTFMDEDYDIVSVGDGDEAVERLAEQEVDLVIADVHMPGADGFEVCRRAKAADPSRAVLLLVGTFEPFDESEAEEAGADAYLKKPFDSQELMRQVETLLAATEETAEEAVDLEEEIAPGADEELEGRWAEPSFERGDESEPLTATAATEEWGEEASLVEADEFETSPWAEAEDEEELDDSDWERAEGLVSTQTSGDLDDEPRSGNGTVSDVDVDRIARRVVEMMGTEVVREIAWEVVPDLAEVVIKDRIRELERQLE